MIYQITWIRWFHWKFCSILEKLQYCLESTCRVKYEREKFDLSKPQMYPEMLSYNVIMFTN